MYKGLPDFCFVKLPTTGETIKVKKGEKGYFTNEHYRNMNPDTLNESIGVTKGQAEAMLIGSMFGWDVPGADPSHYNDDGTPKKEE